MKTLSRRLPSRRTVGAIALIAITLALASCGFSRSAATKKTYLLEPELPAAAATAKHAVVRVGVINIAAPFRAKAFVFRESDLKYGSDYYDEFFIAPAAMLSESVARGLISANIFRRIIAPGAAATDDSDYVLDGFITELYGDMREAPKPAGVFTVTFYLSLSSTLVPNVIWSHEYRQRVPMSDASADALAKAWNTALTTILGELARDLSNVELPAR